MSFLYGTKLPAGFGLSVDAALLYCAGAAWTMFIALALWRARPFKRLEQEVASAWEAVFALVSATTSSGNIAALGRGERVLARRQITVRDAVERARNTLG